MRRVARLGCVLGLSLGLLGTVAAAQPEPPPAAPPEPTDEGAEPAPPPAETEPGESPTEQAPAAGEAPGAGDEEQAPPAPTEPAQPPALPTPEPTPEPAPPTPVSPEANSGPSIELDETTLPAAEGETDDGLGETLVERTGSGSTKRVTLGGYGQHEFIAADGEDTMFRNHRYVVFVYGQLGERISTATEIEFEFAGSPLKRDGVYGPGEVLLEYSVLDFKLFESLVFRAGVVLVPVGSFNINHDAPTREFVDRPIAYTTIVPTTWFESGAGLHGKIPLVGDQELSYEAYVVNGLDARIYDGFGMRAARGSHFEDNNNDKGFTARVAYRPAFNLEVGLSGYTGEYDKRSNRVNMGNVDLQLRLGPVKLLGEAVYAKIDPGFVEGFPESSEANTRDPVPEAMWGYYGQVSYRLPIGEPLRFGSDLSDAALTFSVRYEAKDTDRDRFSRAGDQRRMTFGINFRPIQALVFKSDFQWNSYGTDLVKDAPDVWQSGFWDDRDAGFAFDSYIASVAYLF